MSGRRGGKRRGNASMVRGGRQPEPTTAVQVSSTDGEGPTSAAQRSLPVPAASRVKAPSPAPKSGSGESVDLPSFVHEYQRAYIAHADTKAFGVLAVAGSLVAYIESKGLIDLRPFMQGGAGVREYAGAAACVLLMLAGSLAAFAIAPRLWTLKSKGGGQAPAAEDENGVIFWDDVLTHEDPAAYANHIEGLTGEDSRRQVSIHVYTLAGINRSKYRLVAWALRLGLLGVMALFISLLGGSWRNSERTAQPSSASMRQPSQTVLPGAHGSTGSRPSVGRNATAPPTGTGETAPTAHRLVPP